jgi:hypothetical protein
MSQSGVAADGRLTRHEALLLALEGIVGALERFEERPPEWRQPTLDWIEAVLTVLVPPHAGQPVSQIPLREAA